MEAHFPFVVIYEPPSSLVLLTTVVTGIVVSKRNVIKKLSVFVTGFRYFTNVFNVWGDEVCVWSFLFHTFIVSLVCKVT